MFKVQFSLNYETAALPTALRGQVSFSKLKLHICCNLTPVFWPGESQGRGSLVGCHLWGGTESDTTEAAAARLISAVILKCFFSIRTLSLNAISCVNPECKTCQGVFAVLKRECPVSRAHWWNPVPPSLPYRVGFGNHADEGIKVPMVEFLTCAL